MKSKSVTYVALVILIVAAGIVVFAATSRREVESGGAKVVCAVCGTVLPKEEMEAFPVDSVGLAPDQLPVWVCSRSCAAAVGADPEKYRKAAVSGPKTEDSAEK